MHLDIDSNMKTYKNTGFTLIEVLISMLVIAIGLLGLAGIQMTGLRNNLSSYQRSQATQLAYEIADRMRANTADAQLYSNSVYQTANINGASSQGTCIAVAGACTPALMARHDLFEWKRKLDTLPGRTGQIAVLPNGAVASVPPNPPTVAFYRITVSWMDDRTNNTNQNFTMNFRL